MTHLSRPLLTAVFLAGAAWGHHVGEREASAMLLAAAVLVGLLGGRR